MKSNDNKKYKFSNYFVIKDEQLFCTKNFNFEDNLQNCFYIKKLGSNTHPKIYLDVKQSGSWIVLDKYIGNYNNVIELISSYQEQIICIRGFSRAGICELIKKCNDLKGTNIMPIKFNIRNSLEQHEKNMIDKEELIENTKKDKDKSKVKVINVI